MSHLCAETLGLRGPKRVPVTVPDREPSSQGQEVLTQGSTSPFQAQGLQSCRGGKSKDGGGWWAGCISQRPSAGTSSPLLCFFSIWSLVCPIYRTQGHLQLFCPVTYLCFSSIREQTIQGHGPPLWSTPAAPCRALSVQCVHIECRRIRHWESFLLWSYNNMPNPCLLPLYVVLGKGVHKN